MLETVNQRKSDNKVLLNPIIIKGNTGGKNFPPQLDNEQNDLQISEGDN